MEIYKFIKQELEKAIPPETARVIYAYDSVPLTGTTVVVKNEPASNKDGFNKLFVEPVTIAIFVYIRDIVRTDTEDEEDEDKWVYDPAEVEKRTRIGSEIYDLIMRHLLKLHQTCPVEFGDFIIHSVFRDSNGQIAHMDKSYYGISQTFNCDVQMKEMV